MQITFTPEEDAFRAEVRAFIEAECDPAARERMQKGLGLSKDDYVNWHKKMATKGWSCPHWPVEHGGCDWSPMQHFIFEEETGDAGCPPAVPFGPEMVAPVVWSFGTEEQKAKYLPGILSGEVWWAQGYSEPNAGSDLASLKTKAVLDGDHYVVTGGKTWTTLAQFADWIFLLVRTSSEGKRQQGITFLLVDMNTPGITMHPIITMEGGHEVNQVIFDEVRVPVENRIGEQDKGWTYAKFLLGYERFNMAGIPGARRQLRRLKAVAEDQGVADDMRFRNKMADIDIQIMTLESTMLRLLAAATQGKDPGAESSYIKIRGTEIDQLLTELTMEAVGPYVLPFQPEVGHEGRNEAPIGPEYAAPVAPTYFNTRKVTIYGGSNEIQKNIIAKHVLGL
ncbi:MAG: pimeloyl-CoA dehydrogenase large subunit [Rhodospirillaceae bacterium]|jgi:alkylation response protein AidB-like acyl-CoA dehydrogenase|nr:pimeloyl-CoA dehydrogenase large subunit [Rhodospirillaceae bacterium]MBT6205787.1 pimeloyl-CoA dehydrogenase large subunit [Rhodospirillaceae bacterium]MBT6511648.1 pimeloyl-CoA dehydrogenase large subunit [Rhodospirillaceae bacterium]MBT7613875.1 pimeloyl-CoA dehydrogenase large subunit [Rhodospirillaceae bacterium]MBT7645649.1 pimeloyl-CoA dehydrogenase large subunit [Rhodospirillaceae bacterium]